MTDKEIAELKARAEAVEDRLKRALGIIRPFGEIGQMVLAEAPAEATEFTAFIDCEGDWHKIQLQHLRDTASFLKENDDEG